MQTHVGRAFLAFVGVYADVDAATADDDAVKALHTEADLREAEKDAEEH